MTAETFITLSVIVAALQLIEGLNLYTRRGKLSGLAVVISTLEFIWLALCIYALFAISLPGWTLFLPAAFISYFAVTTWHSRHLIKDAETIESAKELQIPKNFVIISIAFGAVHLVAGGLAWVQYVGV